MAPWRTIVATAACLALVGPVASARADEGLPPDATIATEQIEEGTGGAATTFAIPVTLSAPATQDISASYTLEAGSATADDVTLGSGRS